MDARRVYACNGDVLGGAAADSRRTLQMQSKLVPPAIRTSAHAMCPAAAAPMRAESVSSCEDNRNGGGTENKLTWHTRRKFSSLMIIMPLLCLRFGAAGTGSEPV